MANETYYDVDVQTNHIDKAIEIKCKQFWYWCFLHEKEINELTGYYNIHQRLDKIYELFKKHQDVNSNR